MPEISKRLHENRQIQLAKDILESNGYKISKKSLREDANLEYYGARAASDSDIENLKDMYDDIAANFDGDEWGGYAKELYEKIASMLKAPMEKIYYLNLNTENENEVDLFQELYDQKRTKISSDYIELETEDYNIHTDLYLYKISDTGEIYVSGVEDEGELLYFACVTDQQR